MLDYDPLVDYSDDYMKENDIFFSLKLENKHVRNSVSVGHCGGGFTKENGVLWLGFGFHPLGHISPTATPHTFSYLGFDIGDCEASMGDIFFMSCNEGGHSTKPF